LASGARQSPDARFRPQIEAAVAEGVAREAMRLHLTNRDAMLIARDPQTPLADITYSDGVMRFLGVVVEAGGVAESVLERG
jgi:hypothetical protein